tara:strand:- start:14651 stop:15142 length:492 start_codon:yes stop_codon:yes gene_type:complete
MIILVNKLGMLRFKNHYFRCGLGKNGITNNKKEGDYKTPKGIFNIKNIMYRKDRIKNIKTKIPKIIIKKNHICCDIPSNPNYNKIFKTNDISIGERLWRKDSLYDILVVLDYNLNPIIKNKGSAIFLHLFENKKKIVTKGCISIEKKNMLALLKNNPNKIKIY